MAVSPLDPLEWDKCLGQMVRYHKNISDEIRDIIATIRKEMKQELVPVAEDKATYGKLVKKNIRSMWALEYEIEDLQAAFNKELGAIDIDNLTDDFVEEALLHSKPLQSVLQNIRVRQKEKMDEMIKEYGEKITSLEPLTIPRPPKPEPKPETEKKEEPKAEKASEKPVEQPAGDQPTADKPAEPTADKPEEPATDKPAEAAAEQPAEPEQPVVSEPEPAIESVPVSQEVAA